MASAERELYDRLMQSAAANPTAPVEPSLLASASDPDAGTPISIRNLFTHHDTHPIVIDFALLKAFGLEWMGWEPETIWSEVQYVFKSQISEHARAKVHTVRSLHVSNFPWEKWQVFEKIIQGLNNNIPRWAMMQAPSLEQLFAGVDMMETIRVMEFSDEVKLYMAGAVLNEDVLFVPAPLSFIQTEISQPTYHCRDCGNENSALFHDGVCGSCTRKFSSDLGMRPDTEALNAGRGKNLEVRLKFDPDAVQRRWEEVKSTPIEDVNLEENEVDTQIAKLLVARDYTNIRRRQLAEQLTNLKSWLGAPT